MGKPWRPGLAFYTGCGSLAARRHEAAMTDTAVRLFSYGTLQLPEVQRATFGRLLTGRSDALEGFARSTLVITDPGVVATSGQAEHPVIRPTGDPDDVVEGVIFDLTQAELDAADGYETDAYARVSARSRAGVETWVYVAAD